MGECLLAAHSGRARTPSTPLGVILAPCLVQQGPQDGKRGAGCHLGHSCTRHSTITCSSRWGIKEIRQGAEHIAGGCALARDAVPPSAADRGGS